MQLGFSQRAPNRRKCECIFDRAVREEGAVVKRLKRTSWMDRDIERAEEAYRWKSAGYWSYVVPRAEEFMGNTVARPAAGLRLDPAHEHGLF